MAAMAIAIYRALATLPRTHPGEMELRSAARHSLLIMAPILPMAILIDCTMCQPPPKNDAFCWLGVPEFLLMGLSVLPWLITERRYALGPEGFPDGRWDRAARVLLWLPLFSIPFPFLTLFPKLSSTLDLFLQGGFMTVLCGFIVGVVIEAYRNRWHVLTTVVNGSVLLGVIIYLLGNSHS